MILLPFGTLALICHRSIHLSRPSRLIGHAPPVAHAFPQQKIIHLGTSSTALANSSRRNAAGRNPTSGAASSAKYASHSEANRKQHGNPNIEINKRIVALGRKRDWKGILKLYEKTIGNCQFNNINYATTMSQLGRIAGVNRRDMLLWRFLNELWQELESQGLEWLGVREASNIVHAIAKMQLHMHSSAGRIVKFVVRKDNASTLVRFGNTQDVANVCWSLAKLGQSNVASPLFKEVERHAEELVAKCKPQEIANIAWAFAKLDIQSPRLFTAVEKCAEEFVAMGTPQAIANTAWAFATLGVQSPKLFAVIEKHAEELVANGTTQHIANTAWASATLGIQSSKLFAAIEKHSEKLVDKGRPQEIANTAWAFAKFGFQSLKLFEAIDKHAYELVAKGTPQAIANTAWAFAKLDIQSPKLFLAIEKCANKLVEKEMPQNIVNIAWAFTLQSLTIPKEHLASIVSQDPEQYSNEALQQLAQIIAYSHGNKTKPIKPSLELYTKILALSRNDETKSKFQMEMSCMLAELGLDHEVDVSPFLDGESNVPKSMLSIDLASRDHMVAIEFNGPYRLLRSAETGEVTRQENGPTRAKHRLLERLGWRVINIYYQDWMEAGSKPGQLAFLLNKLEEAGVTV